MGSGGNGRHGALVHACDMGTSEEAMVHGDGSACTPWRGGGQACVCVAAPHHRHIVLGVLIRQRRHSPTFAPKHLCIKFTRTFPFCVVIRPHNTKLFNPASILLIGREQSSEACKNGNSKATELR